MKYKHLLILFAMVVMVNLGVFAQDSMSDSLHSMTVPVETFPPSPDARVIEDEVQHSYRVNPEFSHMSRPTILKKVMGTRCGS